MAVRVTLTNGDRHDLVAPGGMTDAEFCQALLTGQVSASWFEDDHGCFVAASAIIEICCD